ncbi:nucleoside triphosphate pyrophosphohydrolase [Candidatus Roizmanbacteria bacterium]|nr:nucleoside triphosphate pyrophosphohydrolase [Candidatus Roizmanbacteria bacterium]
MMPKLVRDTIPLYLKSIGKTPVFHTANKQQLPHLLSEKLREEIEELIASHSAEEMADVLEVLDAMQIEFGINPIEVGRVKQEKRNARGGFTKGIVLEKVLPEE